jgi:hypothetical protein
MPRSSRKLMPTIRALSRTNQFEELLSATWPSFRDDSGDVPAGVVTPFSASVDIIGGADIVTAAWTPELSEAFIGEVGMSLHTGSCYSVLLHARSMNEQALLRLGAMKKRTRPYIGPRVVWRVKCTDCILDSGSMATCPYSARRNVYPHDSGQHVRSLWQITLGIAKSSVSSPIENVDVTHQTHERCWNKICHV